MTPKEINNIENLEMRAVETLDDAIGGANLILQKDFPITKQSSRKLLLFLNEKSLGEFNVAAKTLCGKIDYSALKDLSLRNWNTPYEMYVGTVKEFEKADVRVQTESGDIRIEKTMEG